ncbi:hypothetical protein [Leeuwenhoekiella sp. NPDC079379]|uniref:hypothetical protein n=1 Tax=Leeuwenhoekiella sp. NPDC079379 TaxID=3364122 RepID=UPI00276CE4E6|nr:hypothetical protein [Leeuwenhoekiella sp.]
MPANSKYLTTSRAQRLLRLLTGFVGGYAITTLVHLLAASYVSKSIALITFTFSGFILWAVLFITAYIPKKTWHALVIYTGISVILGMLLFCVPANQPTL